MLFSGTDPESNITEYTVVYEDKYDIYEELGFKTVLLAASSGGGGRLGDVSTFDNPSTFGADTISQPI